MTDEVRDHVFMWGYLHSFRRHIRQSMNSVLEGLGVSKAGAECLLVGVRFSSQPHMNDACMEPEDGKWPLSFLAGLLDTIATERASHPERHIIYGDRPRMEEKPENIRRDSIRRAVQKTLAPYDTDYGVHSFAGPPAPVADYYVVPVLQLSGALFERFPPLHVPVSDDETVDVLPELPPRIQRSAIATAIAGLEAATADNYDPAINWLYGHRFYLSQKQCDQVNAALDRIRNEPRKDYESIIRWPKFSLHPDLDDSYFLSED